MPDENTPSEETNADKQETEVALDGASCSSRFSWRKSVGRWSQPTTYSLYKGKSTTWLAIVQDTKDGLWFWYGGGRNTCATPTDLKSAKKEAMAHIKSIETNDERVHHYQRGSASITGWRLKFGRCIETERLVVVARRGLLTFLF